MKWLQQFESNTKLKAGLAIAAGLLLILALMTSFPARMGSEAQAALQSSIRVKVSQMPGWLLFEPLTEKTVTGLIFYPEKGVDHLAYAPVLHRIAAEGYLVVVPDMPFNQPGLGINKAAQIQAAYPTISRWVMAGHGSGGQAAAQFARGHTDSVQGLALWASRPGSNTTLKESNLNVLVVSASEDGLISAEDIQAWFGKLPQSTNWEVIQGGNHAQFGDFGSLSNDNKASISPEEQWEKASRITLQLMDFLAP